MNQRDELLSCPFCGGSSFNIAKPKDNPGHESWVNCKSCHCSSGFRHTVEEAVKAWNTRAQAQASSESVGDELTLATVIANVVQAYGVLHGTLTDNPNVHEARKLLLRCLGKEGQKIGIMHANENGKNQFNEDSLSDIQPKPVDVSAELVGKLKGALETIEEISVNPDMSQNRGSSEDFEYIGATAKAALAAINAQETKE